ncbi:MAG: ComEC/Rec2 family competence protein [Candidatus Daviesbacteria bacterium]|nr:MAG: ComEC/Rec2 family competence protein [Candidatus Daviesbacteria bacterium]
MKQFKNQIPLILAILLYILIYFVRWQQEGWEIKLDLFPEFRAQLDKKISLLLPSPQAQLLSGIVLGEKKDLPFDFKLALRDTSTLHMVVVSGQNLSLLAVLLLKLSGFLTRKVAIVLTFLVIVGYVILTGGQIPVIRAALMALLAGLAQLFGRQNDGFWALVLVAAILLLINPAWISDLSFQLSFLATFGVIVVAPVLASYLKRWPPFLRENLSVTVGAQLAVFPVIVQNFHQLSLVSVPANLLTLWTIPYIMSWGLAMLILTAVSDLLARFIAVGLNLILTYFIYVVTFFASLPFAWEYVGEQVWIVWVGYYLVMGGMLLALNKTKE